MPKSIVQSVVFKRSLSSEFGTSNVFTMLLEDGTKGDFLAKEKEIDMVGKELEYEFIPNKNPSYDGMIKEMKQKQPKIAVFNKKNESAENARTALTTSKEMLLLDKIKVADLLKTADKLFDWLQTKSN